MNKLTVLKAFLHDKYLEHNLHNKARICAYQSKEIPKFLDTLCQTSPFYKDYRGRPLSDFPIMDKNKMMDNFSIINTQGLDRDELLKFARYNLEHKIYNQNFKGITVGLSTGTTGEPSLFIANAKERATWAGIMLSRAFSGLTLKELGFKKQRIAFCFRNNSTLYESLSSSFVDLNYLDIAMGGDALAEQLIQYQPTILVAPAQVLNKLITIIPKGAIKPIRVLSCAEVLEPDFEEAISFFLGQKVFQIYQCTEGFLGITSPKTNGIVLNEQYVHIEKEWIDEHRFIPIVTDFTRTSQPIVRYRLNDVLVEDLNSGFAPKTVLKAIEGRMDDVLLFEKNVINKPHYVFADSIRSLMSNILGLKHYRVEQLAMDQFNFYLDPFDGSETTNSKIKGQVENKTQRDFETESLNLKIQHAIQRFCNEHDLKEPNIDFLKLDIHQVQHKFRRIKRNFKHIEI